MPANANFLPRFVTLLLTVATLTIVWLGYWVA
jgi:hypothetical protein